MTLYIKYMVSLRCKIIVKEVLKQMDLQYISVELGIVEIQEDITQEVYEQLNKKLRISGLELLEDKKSILIEKIKNLIIIMIHYSDELPSVKYSNYISKKLNYNYTYLSNTFSEVTGVTIQQYIIVHKIERAKELLRYNELSLTEISYKLNYCSVAHLSYQFKKVTGISVSCYKSLYTQNRTALENL